MDGWSLSNAVGQFKACASVFPGADSGAGEGMAPVQVGRCRPQPRVEMATSSQTRLHRKFVIESENRPSGTSSETVQMLQRRSGKWELFLKSQKLHITGQYQRPTAPRPA